MTLEDRGAGDLTFDYDTIFEDLDWEWVKAASPLADMLRTTHPYTWFAQTDL